MAYWLFKSEATCFSYADLEAEPNRSTGWDGIRNYQARNFLRDEVKVGAKASSSTTPTPILPGSPGSPR